MQLASESFLYERCRIRTLWPRVCQSCVATTTQIPPPNHVHYIQLATIHFHIFFDPGYQVPPTLLEQFWRISQYVTDDTTYGKDLLYVTESLAK